MLVRRKEGRRQSVRTRCRHSGMEHLLGQVGAQSGEQTSLPLQELAGCRGCWDSPRKTPSREGSELALLPLIHQLGSRRSLAWDEFPVKLSLVPWFI